MTVAVRLNSDFDDRLPNEVKIIPEGSGADVKYYAQLGADAASKKRLGSPAYTLPDMQIVIQDTSAGSGDSYMYLPLVGASNVSFRFEKQWYGSPSAEIIYVDGTVEQVFKLATASTADNTYDIALTKEANYIKFNLAKSSTMARYNIYDFTVT